MYCYADISSISERTVTLTLLTLDTESAERDFAGKADSTIPHHDISASTALTLSFVLPFILVGVLELNM